MAKTTLTLKLLDEDSTVLVSDIGNVAIVDDKKYFVSEKHEGGGIIVPRLREATIEAMRQYKNFNLKPPHVLIAEYNG